MANGILPVDFRDDILSEDMNNRRRYQMITNSDGTVSFEDVTKYDQVGSNFGQAQINATNKAVNGLADSIGDAFSEEKTYAVGEYAIYDNALYEFTAAKAAGPWDPDVAESTTIAEALSELNGNLTKRTLGDLLWENPSPSASFAPQTIEIDLSKYQIIAIEYWRPSDNQYYGISACRVGKKSRLAQIWIGGNAFGLITRQYDVNSESVKFYQATAHSAGTSETVNNTLVPMRIYGIA